MNIEKLESFILALINCEKALPAMGAPLERSKRLSDAREALQEDESETSDNETIERLINERNKAIESLYLVEQARHKLEQENNVLQSKLNVSQECVSRVEKTNSELNQQVAQRTDELYTASVKLDDEKDTNRHLSLTIKELQQHLNTYEQSESVKLAACKQAVGNLSIANSELNIACSKLVQDLEKARNDNTHIVGISNGFASEVEQLKVELRLCKAELANEQLLQKQRNE